MFPWIWKIIRVHSIAFISGTNTLLVYIIWSLHASFSCKYPSQSSMPSPIKVSWLVNLVFCRILSSPSLSQLDQSLQFYSLPSFVKSRLSLRQQSRASTYLSYFNLFPNIAPLISFPVVSHSPLNPYFYANLCISLDPLPSPNVATLKKCWRYLYWVGQLSVWIMLFCTFDLPAVSRSLS